MVNKTPFGSKYLPLARIIDELGWDCFLEGRIPITLLEAVGLSLPSRRSIAKWGISFIKTLLSVTHRQWLFQNADVHHDFDGLTMHGHKLLHIRINELLTTTPGDLLPAHRYLLQQDFVQLGNADTIQRQIWVAAMESALGAVSHFHLDHLTPGSLYKFCSARQRPRQPKRGFAQAHHAQRQHQQRPRCHHQQTLPATFWITQQTGPPQETPPHSHSTDVTGTHYRWLSRRK